MKISFSENLLFNGKVFWVSHNLYRTANDEVTNEILVNATNAMVGEFHPLALAKRGWVEIFEAKHYDSASFLDKFGQAGFKTEVLQVLGNTVGELRRLFIRCEESPEILAEKVASHNKKWCR